MSIVGPVAPAIPSRPAAVRSWPSPWSLPMAVLLGCALVLAMTAGKAVAVWTTGIFFDPDDAMRAVEVRDLLAGQGWYDLVQHRLAPGHGVPLHWSRLADLPVAGLIVMFRAPLGVDTAERLARLIEPVVLLVGFMLCQARLGRTLAGQRGALAACLLAAGGLETDSVFIPGHIHHHGLQATLLMALAVLIVDGVAEPTGRAARCAVAGGLAALTLAINLQNLPFVLVAVAALGLGWILRGAAFDTAPRNFALALMTGTAIVFLLQVPSDRYLTVTCDAFGSPHLLAAWAGGAGLLTLSAVSGRLSNPFVRAVAAATVAGVTFLLLRATSPGCLGDPYAGVDPLLRTRWLAKVSEAMPLGELSRRDPNGAVPIAAGLILGLGLIVAAFRASAKAMRVRWAVVLGFALAGVAGTLWEVRVAASAEPFAALGGAWALCRWFDHDRPRKPLAALLCVLSGLALTQAGWVAAMPSLARGGRSAASEPGQRSDPVVCDSPASYEGLAALPAGLVLSPIDSGSQILAYTHHTVLAAPYHRNTYGILLSLRTFDADPASARAMLLDAGVRYVVLCLTSPEVVQAAERAPEGLAARLNAGHPPPWLRATDADRGAVRVFEMAP